MENQEQHNNFVISLAGANIDLTIVNIEEMSHYCEQRGRLASVVTEKKTYEKLEKLNFSLVGNYKKALPRVINTKTKQYLYVYNSLSENYHRGLLIAEADTISDSISDILCNSDKWVKNDVDIMICRNGFSSMTECEMKRANYLRISADPDFDPSIFQKIDKIYEHKVMSLMICQLFVNDQYDTVTRYLNKQSSYYEGQGMTEYVDYSELNKQLAYFIYYDVENDKILNVHKSVILAFMRKLAESGMFPIPKDQLELVADAITL
jgi:hypothetical protein